jgi:hypothetical protein
LTTIAETHQVEDALLFLAIAARNFSDVEKQELLAMLEYPLQLKQKRLAPREIAVSRFELEGEGSQLVTISGYLQR